MPAIVNEEECTACGNCADVCPEGAITIEDVAKVDPDKCTECGTCVDECSTGAISLPD